MSKAVGYVRVSMQGKTHEAGLVREQTDQIRAWCETYDHELERVYVDSGANADGSTREGRPGLEQAMEELQSGTVLVCVSLKKLTHTLSDAVAIARELEDAGAHLALVREGIDSSSPGGRQVLTLLTSMDGLEQTFAMHHSQVVVPIDVAHAPPPGAAPVVVDTGKVAERRKGADRRQPEAERRKGAERRQPENERQDGKGAIRELLNTPVSELFSRDSGAIDDLTGFSGVLDASRKLVGKRQYDQAAALWQWYCEGLSGETRARGLTHFGNLLFKLKRNEEAIETLLEAADIFQSTRHYSKALATLSRILKAAPEHADVRRQLARLNSLCDRVGDAAEAYLSVISLLIDDGKRDEALEVFERIRILDPINPRHRLQLGAEMTHAGFHDEGIAEALYGVDLLIEEGKREEAERNLEQILHLVPEAANAQMRLDALGQERNRDSNSDAAAAIAEFGTLNETERSRSGRKGWLSSVGFRNKNC
ncbi:MAG: recombinase family protein [Leptospirillia bacterium]